MVSKVGAYYPNSFCCRYTTLVRRNFLRFGKRGDPSIQLHPDGQLDPQQPEPEDDLTDDPALYDDVDDKVFAILIGVINVFTYIFQWFTFSKIFL